MLSILVTIFVILSVPVTIVTDSSSADKDVREDLTLISVDLPGHPVLVFEHIASNTMTTMIKKERIVI